MKRLVFAVLTLTCFGASAKDKPLDGKESMTHDYNCMGVSTGRSAVMTVQEFPGGANQILIAENTQKPMALTLSAIDDQTRTSRQYEFKSSNGSAEILQVSDLTGLATTTMLHTVGLEAFTSLVCHEDK